MTPYVLDTFELILNILFIVSGIALAVVPLIWDIKKDAPISVNQNLNVRQDRKVFTTAGKSFILTCAIAIATGAIKFVFDTQHQRKSEKTASDLLLGNQELLSKIREDSLKQVLRDQQCKKDAELTEVKYQLSLAKARDSITIRLAKTEKNINDKSDSNAKKILAKSDSINKSEEPLLDIHTFLDGVLSNINPVLTWNYVNNEGLFTATFINEHKSEAAHLDIAYVEIYNTSEEDETGDRHKYRIGFGRFTKGKIVSHESPYVFTIKISDEENYSSDSLKYIALQVRYKNTNGKTQPILHKIFTINKQYLGRELPVITNKLYEYFEEQLYSLNLWQKQ